jgi:hypothetical protein
MFEEGGFGSEGQNEFGDKLRFDLTESAKMVSIPLLLVVGRTS